MSKKLEDTPTAKRRIKEFIAENKLTTKEVEVKCGYSNGFLSAGGEIGSDRLSKFIENYPTADLYYIVTGKPYKKPDALSEVEMERITLSMQLADVLKKIVELNK